MTEQMYDYQQVDGEPVGYAPPTARVLATYPPAQGCPDTMSVELNIGAGPTLAIDIRAAVQALATVGTVAGTGPGS
jgi:hypothetical protein